MVTIVSLMAAVVAIGGGLLAVSGRDVRTTQLGLLVALLSAPFVADPLPDPLSILIRLAAALLAIRLVNIGLRGASATIGSRIGWPAETLVAAAGAAVGFGSLGLGLAAGGPTGAHVAGLSLLALAAAPLAAGRDVLRQAVGAALLLVGATLVRAGLGPAPSQAEQIATAGLTIALGGAIAVILSAARAAGGLEAVGTADPAARRLWIPDAHRADPERRPRPGPRTGTTPRIARDDQP